MPKTTLPNPAGETDEPSAGGITKADIWKALDEYFRVEQIQPGDVTKAELMAKYSITDKMAQKKMEALCKAHPDEWRMLKVAGRNGERWVLRKLS